MQKKIDSFTNQYPLQKTLRFKLVPIGKTAENFAANKMLEKDEMRAGYYPVVKSVLDSYYRYYIEIVLDPLTLSGINEYASLYYSSNKSEEDKKTMADMEAILRLQIAKALTGHKKFADIKDHKNLIREVLPAFAADEEKNAVEAFRDFTTYFTGFFTNRENMFSSEEKSTAISYRCINDNLPKFLDNARIFEKVKNVLCEKILELDENFEGIYNITVRDMFCADAFSFVLSQRGIDKYNSLIGGYSNSDGTKIQGLNEYINLYNQTHDKNERLPKFKMLFKQILSEKESLSFAEDKYADANALLNDIKGFYEKAEKDGAFDTVLTKTRTLFSELKDYDLAHIYVKNGLDLTEVCSGAFGYWGTVQNAWENEYDAQFATKKIGDYDKYCEKRKVAYKKNDSFSLEAIQNYYDSTVEKNPDASDAAVSVTAWLCKRIGEVIDNNVKTFNSLNEKLLIAEYPPQKHLYNDGDAIALIKDALDSVKELENVLRLLSGSGKEEKDELFYGEYQDIIDRVSQIDHLYNRVRNYVTQKPYSEDKIKLNFDNPQFLGGWDRNKESDYSCVLLLKDDTYYLAVMPKGFRQSFEKVPAVEVGDSVYKKVVYKLLPGPNKMLPKVFFSKKGLDTYCPSKELLKKYEKGTHKTGAAFNIEDCQNLIDFFKQSISIHPDWSQFGFVFSDTSTYNNIGEFYNEVKNQGYKVTFADVPVNYVDSLVDRGELYLFSLYNKDFSSFSKGTKNLHTLYFEMLFNEQNLSDVRYKLNGEAEMFYRPASIKEEDIIRHPANLPVKNKNHQNEKKESLFAYDLIKNKRFTVDQFMLHVPITINFTAPGTANINADVRKVLKDCNNNYVIGIDRGERNLLYICVIDGSGKIVKQFSLNKIVNEYNGKTFRTDYAQKLADKEKDRMDARKNWTAVENIKELKEGYISQVIHKICELVEEYDAVIAMEDLNAGFKNSRAKVEKSVYQKFEKMLSDKLNFYVNKKTPANECGGVLNAYQLTNAFDSFKNMGKQNGFIFYIPAWLTSKIDPSTGFVDLLKPKYESVAAARAFFGAFDRIGYNAEEDYFEFAFNYANKALKTYGAAADHTKKWTVCSYGKRIKTYRDPQNNSEWTSVEVDITQEFKDFFAKYDIDITDDLQTQITKRQDGEFFRGLISLLKLVLQMRNSKTGTDIDYLISPVKNSSGAFYCSDDYQPLGENAPMPCDADANGAYNIARKALWAIGQIKVSDDDKLMNAKFAISNAEWLEYAQTNPCHE